MITLHPFFLKMKKSNYKNLSINLRKLIRQHLCINLDFKYITLHDKFFKKILKVLLQMNKTSMKSWIKAPLWTNSASAWIYKLVKKVKEQHSKVYRALSTFRAWLRLIRSMTRWFALHKGSSWSNCREKEGFISEAARTQSLETWFKWSRWPRLERKLQISYWPLVLSHPANKIQVIW